MINAIGSKMIWFPRRDTNSRAVLFALALLVLGTSVAQAQDIAGALLGRSQLSPVELAQADKNDDGIVDVADLLLQFNAEGSPIASFAVASSFAVEGNERIEVEVFFDRPYSGTVSWSASGTASLGQDYAGGSNSVSVDGLTGRIPIDLIDDSNREEDVETIELLLLASDSFDLGYTQIHTIYLNDNDRIWDGAVINGYADYDFTMEIIRNGSSVSGKLMSDGNGTFPEGDFPLGTIVFANGDFMAKTAPAAIDTDDLMFRKPLERELELRAGTIVPGSRFTDDLISGEATELLRAVDSADDYLNRTTNGTFSMVRRVQPVPSDNLTLMRQFSDAKGATP